MPTVAAWFAGGALAPIALAFAVLISYLPPAEAFRGLIGSWGHIFRGELGELVFYREIRGTVAEVTSSKLLTTLALAVADQLVPS